MCDELGILCGMLGKNIMMVGLLFYLFTWGGGGGGDAERQRGGTETHTGVKASSFVNRKLEKNVA
jgi:hypothetical protein